MRLVAALYDAIHLGERNCNTIYRVKVNKFNRNFMDNVLGNVGEVQSLINRGVQLNFGEFNSLHYSIGLYLEGRMFEMT